MKFFVLNTLWDAFLAVIPVVLGYGAASLARSARRPAWLRIAALAIVLGCWLAFLPNASYVITQWRHLLEVVDANNMSIQAESEPQVLLRIGMRALFYLAYSVFGVLCLTLAIRPVEQMLRARKLPFILFAPALFFLLALGVYLGLIERWNSWDLLTRPRELAVSLLAVPGRQTLMTAITVFALVLWGLYEAADIWVEGVKERLMRWWPRVQWLKVL